MLVRLSKTLNFWGSLTGGRHFEEIGLNIGPTIFIINASVPLCRQKHWDEKDGPNVNGAFARAPSIG